MKRTCLTVTEVRVLKRKGEEVGLGLVMVDLIRENAGCENDL
jgi:hypothetical protein